MAFGYTTYLTEDLMYRQVRVIRGYEVAGVGVVLSVIITYDLGDNVIVKLSENEFLVPGALASDFSPITPIIIRNEDLGNGQRRETRVIEVPSGSVVNNTLYVDALINGERPTIIGRETAYFVADTKTSAGDLVQKGTASEHPWFEWNGVDLTQFDSAVVGANVGSNTVAVETYAGLEWIGIDLTAAVTPTTKLDSGIVLPISATPPTANYRVECDFINTASTGTAIGAWVWARFNGSNAGYSGIFESNAGPHRKALKVTSGTAAPIGPAADGPNITGSGMGSKLSVVVEGSSIVQVLGGQAILAPDTSSPIASTGKAAIGSTVNILSFIRTKNLFRNIRCFSV